MNFVFEPQKAEPHHKDEYQDESKHDIRNGSALMAIFKAKELLGIVEFGMIAASFVTWLEFSREQ